MEIKAIEVKDEPLLNRKTYILKVLHGSGGTPKRYEVRKKVSETLKEDINKVFVIKMETEYGKNESKVKVQVYNSPEEAEKLVPDHLKKRNKPREKAKETGT